MANVDWLTLSDGFGVLVFAISGALAAGRRSMDIFGVLVIGFVTALGGGTLRDLLLGIHPVSWIKNPVYLLLVTIAVILTLLGGRISHRFDERIMIVSDAFGLAVFTVIGVQIALQQSFVSPPVAIMMGVITGVAGGAIRDVICNDIPLVLKREIYATASAACHGFQRRVSGPPHVNEMGRRVFARIGGIQPALIRQDHQRGAAAPRYYGFGDFARDIEAKRERRAAPAGQFRQRAPGAG